MKGGGGFANLSLILNSHLHKYAYVWYVSLNFIYHSKILHLLSINSNFSISQSEPKYVHSGPKIYHVFAKYLFKAKARNTYFAKLNYLCQRFEEVFNGLLCSNQKPSKSTPPPPLYLLMILRLEEIELLLYPLDGLDDVELEGWSRTWSRTSRNLQYILIKENFLDSRLVTDYFSGLKKYKTLVLTYFLW